MSTAKQWADLTSSIEAVVLMHRKPLPSRSRVDDAATPPGTRCVALYHHDATASHEPHSLGDINSNVRVGLLHVFITPNSCNRVYVNSKPMLNAFNLT